MARDADSAILVLAVQEGGRQFFGECGRVFGGSEREQDVRAVRVLRPATDHSWLLIRRRPEGDHVQLLLR